MKTQKLIEQLEEELPDDIGKRLLHILKKCKDYFNADFCNYVAPNYETDKWQLVAVWPNDSIEKKETAEFEIQKTTEFQNLEEIRNKISMGICNVALNYRKVVCVPKTYEWRQYVKVHDRVQSEIIIPLFSDRIATSEGIGCIVLAFVETSHDKYNAATGLGSEEYRNIEKSLGDFIVKKVYAPAEERWSEANLTISRLRKIDFDDVSEIMNFNQILSKLLPKLKYYSVWAATTDQEAHEANQCFVRIGSFFADKDKDTEHRQGSSIIDYTFNEGNNTTYGQLLKEAIKSIDKETLTFEDKHLIKRKRIEKETHTPIDSKWKELLYIGGETSFDLHFIPIVETMDEKKLSISAIFIYFFEDVGDPRIITVEKLEAISHLSYERIRYGRYLRIKKLRGDIRKLSNLIFNNYDEFLKRICEELLNTFPSEAIDLWEYRTDKVLSTLVKRTSRTNNAPEFLEPIRSEVQIPRDKISKCCLNPDTSPCNSKISHKKYGGMFTNDECENCSAIVHISKLGIDWQSCMTINVNGSHDEKRYATLNFYNRIDKYLNNKRQAYSNHEKVLMSDIASDIGVLLSVYYYWKKEEDLKTILPHEFAAPVGTLADKIKSIENTLYDIVYFSDFLPEEFVQPHGVENLCSEIRRDNYRLRLNSPPNTIEWLNELIRQEGFYAKVKAKKKFRFSRKIEELSEAVINERENLSLLTAKGGSILKRFNRLIIEELYPFQTPPIRMESFLKETPICDIDVLKKRIDDTWLIIEAIQENATNNIRFLKKDSSFIPINKIDLRNLLDRIKHLFIMRYKGTKNIFIDLPNDNCDVLANQSILVSVFHNIFDNAFKYGHDYTVLDVKYGNEADNTIIKFISYGIEIKEDESQKVFDLYYQSEMAKKFAKAESDRSRGVGLALAKWHISTCHNGRIYFNPSSKVSKTNPFLVYIVKKYIINMYPDFVIDPNVRQILSNEQVPVDVYSYFNNDKIKDFFSRIVRVNVNKKKLKSFKIEFLLRNETFKNELIITLPRKR